MTDPGLATLLTFGTPGQLSAIAWQGVVAALIMAPALGLLLRKALSLRLPATALVTAGIYTVAMVFLVNSLASRFHTLEATADSVVLTFRFPHERRQTLAWADITDVRFGLEGDKGPHRCYLALHTRDDRLASQSSQDCDALKQAARRLRAGQRR